MQSDRDRIIDLETRFWQSMVEKDIETAKGLIAGECLVTGPAGAMKIDPEKYARMTREGRWRLDHFEFSDVDVVFPAEDVAVIAYKVHQTGEMNDGPMDLTCADASTWVCEQGGWKCTLHTETILQDAATSTRH